MKGNVGVPEGIKRVPRSPVSLTLILWTPGAMYHLSMSVEARGVRSLKPSAECPVYTEMLTSKGLLTFIFLNLADIKKANKHHSSLYRCDFIDLAFFPLNPRNK